VDTELDGTRVNHLLDHDVDLAHFDARFRNDKTGAPAYPPAMLLKVVLFAYSQGIVRSRAIERVCQEHVTFMALCGTTAPHSTTIAHFVSTLRDDIAQVVAAVLAMCDGQGLIGREMVAIDGVKLPSGADDAGAAPRDRGTRPGTRCCGEDHGAHRAADAGCAAVARVARRPSGGSPRPDEWCAEEPPHRQ
jgi:hypothetical protein